MNSVSFVYLYVGLIASLISTGCTSNLDLRLSSNKENTQFIVDGKEVGIFQRGATTIEHGKEREHIVIAKLAGYCDKRDVAKPPYLDPTTVDFTFKEDEDCEQNDGIHQIANKISIILPNNISQSMPENLEFGNFYALVIGNNDYNKKNKYPPLRTAIQDATSVAEILKEYYGFQVELLVNAKHKDIIDAFEKYKDIFNANTNNHDSFMIYYAGHGEENQTQTEGYWIPVDAEENSKNLWISSSEIIGEIKSLQVKHLLVVADSCYSGELLDAGATRSVQKQLPKGLRGKIITRGSLDNWKPYPRSEDYSFITNLLNGQSRAALTSGSREPVVDGCPGIKDGHSCFAHEFINLLRSNNTVLDTVTLFNYIRGRVSTNTTQMPKFGPLFGTGDDGGDFLFIKR